MPPTRPLTQKARGGSNESADGTAFEPRPACRAIRVCHSRGGYALVWFPLDPANDGQPRRSCFPASCATSARKVVPCAPCRFFDADAPLLRQGGNVRQTCRDWQAPSLSQFNDKVQVSLPGLAANAVVERCNVQVYAETGLRAFQYMEQSHRITATRNRDNHRLNVGQGGYFVGLSSARLPGSCGAYQRNPYALLGDLIITSYGHLVNDPRFDAIFELSGTINCQC